MNLQDLIKSRLFDLASERTFINLFDEKIFYPFRTGRNSVGIRNKSSNYINWNEVEVFFTDNKIEEIRFSYKIKSEKHKKFLLDKEHEKIKEIINNHFKEFDANNFNIIID